MGNRERIYREHEKGMKPFVAILIAVGVSAVVTILLLLLATVIIYNTSISGTVSGILMVAIYVLGPFAGAFVLGKLVKRKRYLWGLLLGAIYFLMFFGISRLCAVPVEQGGTLPGLRDYIEVLLAVLPGGILGGMFS